MNSDYGESLQRWLRPGPFALFLALALFACFPQVLVGTESFFFRDYGVLGYPNIQFYRESFWRGELPMWNPLSNCGQPFLAQWGTMVLYPFSLIYLLLPLPWSLSIFCFAHVWLGGFGMYLLARRWTSVNFAGAIAGTLYVFNGIMFSSFIWPNYLVTLGWMPFVVLLTERAWREGGRWIVGASIVAGLQMLSGAPEVILFTWLIVSALWLCDALRTPVSTLPFFRRLIFIVLLTAGLAAMQLLPFFELLRESHRDTGFATAKWQLPLWGWANFLVPLYNAIETPSGQYFQHGQAFLSSVYLGGVAVVLAVVAVFRWPDPRLRILFLISLAAIVLSFGDQTPVFAIARKLLPVLGFARYPVKLLYLPAFIIPLMAGCGIAAIARGKLRGTAVIAGLLALVAVSLIAWAGRTGRFVDSGAWPDNVRGNVYYSWNKTEPGHLLPDAIANTLWRITSQFGALVLLAGALRSGKNAPALALGSLALMAADVRFHSPLQNPTLPSAEMTGTYWPDGHPKLQAELNRVLITPQAEDFLTFVSSTNASRVWQLRRRAEWSNLNMLDGIAKVNGSSTLQTRQQRLVEQTLYGMTNRLPSPLLDFLGVSYLTDTNTIGQWSPRESKLPLVTAGQQIVFQDDAATLAAITNAVFVPGIRVLLSPDANEFVSQTNAVPATLSDVRVTARLIEARVSAPQPSVVVIAQSFYPSWKATVDNMSTPVLRANLAFQAVTVPSGEHLVRVFYDDAHFRAGTLASALSLLICGGVWWRAARRRPS